MPQRKLKLGHIYIIDYDDHFTAARVESDDESSLRPIVIQSIGRLVAITPKQYNLENYRRIDGGDESYNHSIHGIMKSCILNVQDLGPRPAKRKKGKK